MGEVTDGYKRLSIRVVRGLQVEEDILQSRGPRPWSTANREESDSESCPIQSTVSTSFSNDSLFTC